MLQLPLGEKYFILQLHDLNLLLLQLHLLLLDSLILLLIGVDAVFLLLLLLRQNLIHLFSQLVDLCLKFDILLNHLLPIGVVLLNLALDLGLVSLFEVGLVFFQLLLRRFGWAGSLHVEVLLLVALLYLPVEVLFVVVVVEF